MTYKLKISKQGYNAITDTNNDHLIFSSDYGTLRYLNSASGSITLTVNYAQPYLVLKNEGLGYEYTYFHEKIGSFDHNLGYNPVFVAYYYNNNNNRAYLLPYNYWELLMEGSSLKTELFCYTDTSKLYFHILIKNYTNSGTENFTFYYKIFKNNTGL